MRALDQVVAFFLFLFVVTIAVIAGLQLVTTRHQVRVLNGKVWALEQNVNALYLAADWDVAAPFLDDGDDDAGQGAQ